MLIVETTLSDLTTADREDLRQRVTALALLIFSDNCRKGWWDDSLEFTTQGSGGVPDKYLIPTKISLMHSELSEALEGMRKGIADNHLAQYPMEAVEYADTIIRILDVCGYKGYDIGAIIIEKLTYNATREDHKREVRAAPGGKSV